MTLNAETLGFIDFLVISGCNTSLYHWQGGATDGTTELSLCDPERENLVFVY